MPASDSPRVSVIIPAREEAEHIEACVRSVLGQDIEGGMEVLVVDALSADGTAMLARAAGATVVENPERVIPAALNRGLAAARGSVIVRFDAHAEMPPGYLSACLRALEEEDAANVGGWCEVRGSGPWGRALGRALASPLGIGNARLWRRPPPGYGRREIASVHYGCFRRRILGELGGWREDLHVNEDFELDHRLRAAGGKVVFDPAIWSIYYPRESLAAIARQYHNYGRWKAEMLALAPRSLRGRQVAPPALLAIALAAVAPTPLALPARAALMLYGAALVAEAARMRAGWRLPVMFATIHVAWGLGLVTRLPAAAIRRARAARRPPPEPDARRSMRA